MFYPGNLCTCGQPGRIVYDGLCEDCWLNRPSLRTAHREMDEWIAKRLAEENLPDRSVPKYSAHHRP